MTNRAKNTSDVGYVLKGEGFKQTKPGYASRPEIRQAEIQHRVLSQNVDFEKMDRTYGKPLKPRHLEDPMSAILAWGEFDEHVKNDFTSAKGAFSEKFKINKMGVSFITEKQDNFRDHVKARQLSKEQRIVDYLQDEGQVLTKKKVNKNLLEKELMKDFSTFTTEYRE